MDQKTYMSYIIIQNTKEKGINYSEIEVIYVVVGQAQVTTGDGTYYLHKSDIKLIHAGEGRSIRCDDMSALCIVSYSKRLISALFPYKAAGRIHCNSLLDTRHSYDKVREVFKELIRNHISQKVKNECYERSLLYKLLGCLAEEFGTGRENGEGILKTSDEDGRMQHIYQYIEQNFQGNISLSELAEQMYTSTSTLSRLFKKKTGIFFAEYINKVRLEYAVQELLCSDDSITKIAIDSGFSNLSVFNRVFKESYGMSPSEYRKAERLEGEKEEADEEAIISNLRKQLSEELSEQNLLQVSADAANKKQYSKSWNQTINVGSVNTLLMANTQYHVVYLTENLGFRYVRLWNVFSIQMKITDGKHMGNYNYDQLDIAFDFLDQHHIIPFLDFGVRPSAAVKNENVNVYYGEECVEFATRDAWEEMITDFFRHMVKRYGKEKVETWIFELSYDLTHKMQCYQDDNYEFYHAYEFLYRTVKKTLPGAQIGGPMAIVHYSAEFVREFLEKSKNNSCVPDFVSMLLFPYTTHKNGQETGYKRAMNDSYEIREVKHIHSIMDQAGVSCKLYVSEWNNTLSSRNYLNDSSCRAAYFIDKLNELWEQVDMINVWMASDWVSNYFDVGGVANGGNGLLTKNTICKPAYYALSFLNQLGDYLLARGKNYLITRTEQQDYYILCSNYKSPGEEFFFNDSYIEQPQMMNRLYEDETSAQMEFTLQNMAARRYVVKKRTVNPREGSLLWEWEKFDFDHSLSSQDIKYIRQISLPRISMKKCETLEGRLKLCEKIGAQEIILIHIYEET